MILVKPSFEIIGVMSGYWTPGTALGSLRLIERAGRTCYKSEDKTTPDSAKKFIKSIIKNGHESVIEHSAITVKFVVDRGVSHELVRHRLASFSQESTRYVSYKGGCTFIIPPWTGLKEGEYPGPVGSYSLTPEPEDCWFASMLSAEADYQCLLDRGWSPQQARSILPNSTKTEIVMTANFREWRHVLKLRSSKTAHPQMREIMLPLLAECKKRVPVIFDNIRGDHDTM